MTVAVEKDLEAAGEVAEGGEALVGVPARCEAIGSAYLEISPVDNWVEWEEVSILLEISGLFRLRMKLSAKFLAVMRSSA
jgi:hypothetical protein